MTTDTAQQLLEAWEDGLSYKDLVLTFADEIIEERDFGDYQGDTVVHLRRGTDHGVLIFGFGSCSGCDALQAAEGYASSAEEFESRYLGDVVALRDQLAASVKWASEGPLEPRMREQAEDWWGYEREMAQYVLGLARTIDAL